MEQIEAFTPNDRGPDFAFECSGYPYYQQKCLDALRHYGTLVLLGYAAHEGKELKWELNTEHGLCRTHKTIPIPPILTSTSIIGKIYWKRLESQPSKE